MGRIISNPKILVKQENTVPETGDRPQTTDHRPQTDRRKKMKIGTTIGTRIGNDDDRDEDRDEDRRFQFLFSETSSASELTQIFQGKKERLTITGDDYGTRVGRKPSCCVIVQRNRRPYASTGFPMFSQTMVKITAKTKRLPSDHRLYPNLYRCRLYDHCRRPNFPVLSDKSRPRPPSRPDHAD